MRYKLLGRSGLRVSELALGTMTFGENWGWGASKDESRAMFEAFAEAGGNFIDTANRYTDGTSEEFVGEFVKGDREAFVVASKYSLFTRRHSANDGGNQRKNLVQSVEGSLKRLSMDYIDLLWLHAWDGMTPVEEIMRSLDDLVRAGKILYVAISDTPAWQVSRANMLAELRGWTPFVALQIEYSLIMRDAERDLLPMANELELAVTPWGILGGGVLTGKYNKPDANEPKRMNSPQPRTSAANLRIAAEVVAIAEEIGRPASQVATNWVRQQGLKVPMIPIIGARSVKQVRDNLACLEFALTREQMARLDAISQIPLGFPHDFLSSGGVRDVTFGGYYERIDNHRK
ncbi:MAG: aldo/keto reductase [Chloroflexi bacterium]|nr:aldo/keto reductase [Chloroflexota bacterium]